jgi:hypothetical protein
LAAGSSELGRATQIQGVGNILLLPRDVGRRRAPLSSGGRPPPSLPPASCHTGHRRCARPSLALSSLQSRPPPPPSALSERRREATVGGCRCSLRDIAAQPPPFRDRIHLSLVLKPYADAENCWRQSNLRRDCVEGFRGSGGWQVYDFSLVLLLPLFGAPSPAL